MAEIISRLGICKPASGTYFLDVGGASSFDGILNLKANLNLEDTASIEAATGFSGEVRIGATATTTTIRIGSGTHAKAIVIGNTNDTVTIQGTVTANNTTNLNVADKLITVNKGGAAASGADAGIEVEENSVLTGHIKVSSDRNAFNVKAPNRSGTIAIQPGTASVVTTITSLAASARTWTIPDVSDTFVGLTATQTLTNKTLTTAALGGTTTITGTLSNSATSTHSGTNTFTSTASFTNTMTVSGTASFSNNVTFTGAVSGVGIVPLGAVIPVMSHLTGTLALPASGTVVNGWMRCDGAVIPGGNTVTGTTPNLSDNRFIMGATTSGTLGGFNSYTLTNTFAGTAAARSSWFLGTNYTPAGSITGSVGAINTGVSSLNLQHSHTVNDHTHGVSHNHIWAYNDTNQYYSSDDSGFYASAPGPTKQLTDATDTGVSSTNRRSWIKDPSSTYFYTYGARMENGSLGTLAQSGGSTPGTNNQLGTSVSIAHTHTDDFAFSGTAVARNTWAAAGDYTPAGSVSISLSGDGGPPTINSFDNRPDYVSAVYLIRVK